MKIQFPEIAVFHNLVLFAFFPEAKSIYTVLSRTVYSQASGKPCGVTAGPTGKQDQGDNVTKKYAKPGIP